MATSFTALLIFLQLPFLIPSAKPPSANGISGSVTNLQIWSCKECMAMVTHLAAKVPQPVDYQFWMAAWLVCWWCHCRSSHSMKLQPYIRGFCNNDHFGHDQCCSGEGRSECGRLMWNVIERGSGHIDAYKCCHSLSATLLAAHYGD